MIRGILTIVIIILFYVDIPSKFVIILGLFVIASLTDNLDGRFARRWKVESTFGKVFDSLFDKILVISLFMLLLPYDIVPGFIFIALVFRELLVDGLKNYLLSKGAPISPRKSGKIKMWMQVLMIIFMLLYLIIPGNEIVYGAVVVSTAMALILAYYSAYQYMRTFYIFMKK